MEAKKKKTLKYFVITRYIKEEFQVEAFDREDAKRILGEDGSCPSVTLIKETVKQVK